jgi:hypothetical protein
MIDASKVVKVYSGRQGCMCGCRGKYSYASAHASQRPDYLEADEGISDRGVKLIVGKLNKDPNTKVKDGIAWVDRGNRTLVAYLEEAA